MTSGIEKSLVSFTDGSVAGASPSLARSLPTVGVGALSNAELHEALRGAALANNLSPAVGEEILKSLGGSALRNQPGWLLFLEGIGAKMQPIANALKGGLSRTVFGLIIEGVFAETTNDESQAMRTMTLRQALSRKSNSTLVAALASMISEPAKAKGDVSFAEKQAALDRLKASLAATDREGAYVAMARLLGGLQIPHLFNEAAAVIDGLLKQETRARRNQTATTGDRERQSSADKSAAETPEAETLPVPESLLAGTVSSATSFPEIALPRGEGLFSGIDRKIASLEHQIRESDNRFAAYERLAAAEEELQQAIIVASPPYERSYSRLTDLMTRLQDFQKAMAADKTMTADQVKQRNDLVDQAKVVIKTLRSELAATYSAMRVKVLAWATASDKQRLTFQVKPNDFEDTLRRLEQAYPPASAQTDALRAHYKQELGELARSFKDGSLDQGERNMASNVLADLAGVDARFQTNYRGALPANFDLATARAVMPQSPENLVVTPKSGSNPVSSQTGPKATSQLTMQVDQSGGIGGTGGKPPISPTGMTPPDDAAPAAKPKASDWTKVMGDVIEKTATVGTIAGLEYMGVKAFLGEVGVFPDEFTVNGRKLQASQLANEFGESNVLGAQQTVTIATLKPGTNEPDGHFFLVINASVGGGSKVFKVKELAEDVRAGKFNLQNLGKYVDTNKLNFIMQSLEKTKRRGAGVRGTIANVAAISATVMFGPSELGTVQKLSFMIGSANLTVRALAANTAVDSNKGRLVVQSSLNVYGLPQELKEHPISASSGLRFGPAAVSQIWVAPIKAEANLWFGLMDKGANRVELKSVDPSVGPTVTATLNGNKYSSWFDNEKVKIARLPALLQGRASIAEVFRGDLIAIYGKEGLMGIARFLQDEIDAHARAFAKVGGDLGRVFEGQAPEAMDIQRRIKAETP
ncbi:hypothetical protein SAMN06265795_10919 [Noviherbaspirillum humi]|uniref:Uncharacterized protein n=1 Tax=Noviherbaspirillum humi TaxID=1688639 RepID=A0A239IAI5_9BURK|nr:hypothetical protein [Noviherbaspirillum humi]SNS90549.1 hypothetical protein SAMN06265795_10919 [Noviherbaspirillum humi]